jgi:hypothetical protein
MDSILNFFFLLKGGTPCPKMIKKPVAPHMAVGLSTVVYGIAERKHIKINAD